MKVRKIEDFCVKCLSPLEKIEVGGKLPYTLICINQECDRFGLLTVVGKKIVPKKDEKSGDKKL